MYRSHSELSVQPVAGGLISSSGVAHADIVISAHQTRATAQAATQQQVSKAVEQGHITASASSSWYVYAWYFTSVQCEYYGVVYQLEVKFSGSYCAASLPPYGPPWGFLLWAVP